MDISTNRQRQTRASVYQESEREARRNDARNRPIDQKNWRQTAKINYKWRSWFRTGDRFVAELWVNYRDRESLHRILRTEAKVSIKCGLVDEKMDYVQKYSHQSADLVLSRMIEKYSLSVQN